ncbi:MAG: GTP-binding protein [Helicobacteraceae bacterium]|jgi:small GTP-binding protein|nr:GTP-binding protein [Helicobacteraceae bacterium]
MVCKKICVLGSSAAGKTSLVNRYVHSIFDDRYLSTIGVKISKKELSDVTLVIWDIEGKDIYTNINLSYLRGAAGYFVVADGSRIETLNEAMVIRQSAIEVLGASSPCYLLLNKRDLVHKWEIAQETIDDIKKLGVKIFTTSAKTGRSVDEAFETLAKETLKQ